MTIEQLLAPIRRRLDNIIARAAVAMIDDTGGLQLAQLALLGGVRDRCARIQQYGFTAVPLAGAEALVVFLGGKHDHPVVIGIDDRRYRKHNMVAGEVAMYTDQGDYILIARDGHITVKASADVTVDAPLVHCTGNVTIDGDATITGNLTVNGSTGASVPNGDVVAGSIHLKTHKHGGVTAGGAQTGVPV